MRSRTDLSTILHAIPGAKKVYFQPPTGLQMTYPCIVYKLVGIDDDFANNHRYAAMKKYEIIVIDEDPDSTIYEKILELEYSSLRQIYVSDHLYHYVCNLYF